MQFLNYLSFQYPSPLEVASKTASWVQLDPVSSHTEMVTLYPSKRASGSVLLVMVIWMLPSGTPSDSETFSGGRVAKFKKSNEEMGDLKPLRLKIKNKRPF